jgi:hypothetical protein
LCFHSSGRNDGQSETYADQRRALEILAGSPHGVTEPTMRAHGFTVGLLAGLVRDGLATATPKTVHAGRQPIEVTWLTVATDSRSRASARAGAAPSRRVLMVANEARGQSMMAHGRMR